MVYGVRRSKGFGIAFGIWLIMVGPIWFLLILALSGSSEKEFSMGIAVAFGHFIGMFISYVKRE